MNKYCLIISLSLVLAACGKEQAESEVNSSPQTPAKLADAPAEAAMSGFNQSYELNGIKFLVEATRSGSLNTLTITPNGLTESNEVIVREIDGAVANAEVDDLDADGSPEIYVYVNSAGSGSYGSLIAYSANKGKSLSEIYLPPLDEDKVNAKGYMGHDEFAVVEGNLVRRFPTYNEGDTNAQPSGKTRQIQYKLKPGEAGWVLQIDKVVEY